MLVEWHNWLTHNMEMGAGLLEGQKSIHDTPEGPCVLAICGTVRERRRQDVWGRRHYPNMFSINVNFERSPNDVLPQHALQEGEEEAK